MFSIATIADIHWNAVNPDKLNKELTDVFLKYIRTHKIDMIVIAGDYYDSIVSLNSKASKLSMQFMANLIELSSLVGVKYIRIIKGTSSHDNNQLSNLKVFEMNEKVNFKIYETVTKEDIEGYHILFLPEEYMKNVDEYYEDFFHETYDIIFGHGMFKETSFVATKQESAITLSKAPVFDSKAFCEMCNGPILFGHIHTSCNIKKKITYVGSFSRWVYGEEEPKGFYVTIIEGKEWKNEFIENTEAERYDTVTIINLEEYKEPEDFIREMESFRKDNLRISLVLEGGKDYSYILSALREYYAKNPHYKLKTTDKTVAIKEAKQEERMTELLEKYGFIFDTNIPRSEKISKFIKVRDNQDISTVDVAEILSLS